MKNLKQFYLSVKIIFVINVIIFGVYFLAQALHFNLYPYGIVPRNVHSLPYILTAPWIHANWYHLTSNAIGLSLFSFLAMVKGRRFFFYSSAFIIVASGLLIWACARPAVHVGASGWIFGLWTLSIANAYFDRKILNFLIAVAVVFFYGGMIYGLMPSNPHVSYEGHIFGALAGIAAANLFRRVR